MPFTTGGGNIAKLAYDKSNEALSTANDAKTTSDNVQTQLDAVVNRATDSDAMSAQAAVDAHGVNKVNLKTRLDDDYNEFSDKIGTLQGSVNANTQSLLDIVVNVKNYGADPTFTFECSAAFQQAINYVASLGGGMVYVPAGHYKVYQSVVLNSDNIHLIGSGWNTHIESSATVTSLGEIFGITGTSDSQRVNNCSISNMKITANASVDNAIGITKANTVLVYGIYVDKSLWKGITVQNSCKNVKIMRSLVEHCSKYGIGTENNDGLGVVDVTIADCEANYCTEQGFFFSGTGNRATTNGYILSRLRARNNTLSGLYLGSLQGAELNQIIAENNLNDGVELYKTIETELYGVQANSNTNNGLSVKDIGDKVKAYGGKYKNNGTGIYVTAPNTTLIDPDCDSNTNYGLYVFANTTTVRGGKYAGATENVHIDSSALSTFTYSDSPISSYLGLNADIAVADTNYNNAIVTTVTRDFPRKASIAAELVFTEGATGGLLVAYITVNGANFSPIYCNCTASTTYTFNLAANVSLNKGSNTITLTVKSFSGGGTIKKYLTIDSVSRGGTSLSYTIV